MTVFIIPQEPLPVAPPMTISGPPIESRRASPGGALRAYWGKRNREQIGLMARDWIHGMGIMDEWDENPEMLSCEEALDLIEGSGTGQITVFSNNRPGDNIDNHTELAKDEPGIAGGPGVVLFKQKPAPRKPPKFPNAPGRRGRRKNWHHPHVYEEVA